MQTNNPKWITFLLTSCLVASMYFPLQVAAKGKETASWEKLINDMSKTNPDFISYRNKKTKASSKSKGEGKDKNLSKKEKSKQEKEGKKADKKSNKLTARQLKKLDRKLYKAVKAGDTEKVKEYILQHADTNYSNRSGMSLLHIAAGRGYHNIVLILTSHGADVHAETIKGWTPLHHAARFGHVQTVRHLLSKGAKINKANSDGKNPYALARQLHHDEVVKLFQLWNKYH